MESEYTVWRKNIGERSNAFLGNKNECLKYISGISALQRHY